ncbi:MAG: (deoxy)nucleoside triphosphate pyrophosphohydrolase [Clostridium sp.]|jgi:8-oxo-dGTP diphosphatase|nr:(deoxy)nucleoside triphosphate pyrophosphohydrolase [Clostridium sp.]
MKKIEVVAAIIEKKNQFLATQRGYGEFKGMWEFPGGKVEPGENKQDALLREIEEELNVNILIKQYLCTVDYQYPTFHLTMHCYICKIDQGDIILNEHLAAKWLIADELNQLEWLPADIDVVKQLENYARNNKLADGE